MRFTNIRFEDPIVTPKFREAFLQLIAHLKPDRRCHYEPYLRLAAHFLTTTFRDDDTHMPVVPWTFLNSLRNGSGKGNSFRAGEFLQRFSERIFPIGFGGYSYRKQRARALDRMEIPDWLEQALYVLCKASPTDRTVELVSGRSTAMPSAASRSQRALAEMRQVEPRIPRLVLEYMNSLDDQLFDFVDSKFDAAHATVAAVPHQPSRVRQLALLLSLKSDPKLRYHAVDRSTRIFTNGGFLMLKSSIRDQMLADFVKVDLKQAQMQIVSILWDMPEVHCYLSSYSNGLWHELAQWCGIDIGFKPKLKKAVYCILFGMGVEKAKAILRADVGNDAAEAFFKHEVIVAIIGGRERRLARLFTERYVEDAFGRRLELPAVESVEGEYSDAMSILACEAQSYEMAILEPVIRYIQSANSTSCPVHCIAWLHDGFWLKCDDPIQREVHLEEISRIISESSTRLLRHEMQVDVARPSKALVSGASR